MQARLVSCHRLIVSHPEHAVRRLGLVAGAPPGDERAPESGVEEINRDRVVEYPAHTRGCHGPTIGTAILIEPSGDRTERTPSLLAARATQLGVSPEDAERQDFAPDSPRGNAICRMVDASEIAFVSAFLASDKAWAVSGELVAATGGAGRTVFY
jgi:hypothetical protein